MRRLAVFLSLFAVTGARAQTGAIDAEQFHPPATSNGFFSVDGAFTPPHLGFSAGLFLTYAHDPLVLRSGGKIITGGQLISDQLGMDAVASFAIFRRLELGVDLPFVPAQSFDNSFAKLPHLHVASLGDLRIDLKGVLWAPHAHGHRFALSAIAGLVAPTGDSGSFASEDAVAGRFRLVAEWRAPWARAALELGAQVQPDRAYYDLHVGTQLLYGVGVGVPLPRGFALIGEIAGKVGVALPKGATLTSAEAPAEASLGVSWRFPFGLEFLLAGGGGLSRGYGTPDGRFIFGVRFTSPEPVEPMPTEKVVQRPAPPPPPPPPPVDDTDSDGDGTPDRLDACPDKPGPQSNAGCPQTDTDGDGVPDVDDRCPQKAGSAANQGCPDFDSDGDGIVDRLDKCPFDPEVFNGVDDDDGCPDQPAALAAFSGDKIQIFEPVLFEKDGSVVDKRSYKLLSVVAHLLRLHTEILKMRIEGHTDNKGMPLELLDLSRARAAAVRHWLIDHGGVEPKRLVAEGFGPDKPIADNRDFVGRAKNRRIEFVVVQKLDASN